MERIYFHPSESYAPVTLALSATDAVAAPEASRRGYVRLASSVDAWVDLGFHGNAAKDTAIFLPAGRPEIFKVRDGAIISAVADTATTGNLNIVVME